jgi:hypothetical protein
MTMQDLDPANLTPEQITQLRADFQSTGMSPAEAEEAADTLVRMVSRPPGMDCATDRMGADMRYILATLTRIEARLAEMAQADRLPHT